MDDTTPKQPKDPRSWLVFVAALLPFIVATLYMSFKPPAKRVPRTHGGSNNPPYPGNSTGADAGAPIDKIDAADP